MALNLIGSEGLFVRLGHLIHAVDGVANIYRGTNLPNRIDVIQSDYSSVDQNLVDGIYSRLSSAQASGNTIILYFRSLAQNTVTQMINEYQPQYRYSYANALAYLMNYLATGSESVLRNTVSAVVTPGLSNFGNGVVVFGTYNNLGFPLEQMFNESVIGNVTRDSSGGANPGQETFQFSGTYGTTDMLNWLWPQGSNALVNLTAISPSVSNSSGSKNWLNNGMMETFTVSNVPDNWHVRTGTPGTTILKDTTNFYDGANSVKFVGDGSEMTSIWTQFGVDFNTAALSEDQLAVSLWYKLSSSPGAGVLQVALRSVGGSILTDSSGANSLISANLAGSGTSWTNLSGFLRTPTVLPSSMYLAITLSTPLTSAVTISFDHASMARPPILYQGGPQIACFSGNANWMLGDTFQVSVNNAFNGLMQSGCNKLLNLKNYGLILPSTTGTPTIPDSLVT